MKLLDAGEVLPSDMILSLVGKKLANRECQKKGWVVEGVGAAGGVDELEEAIVMATEVSLFGPCFVFLAGQRGLLSRLTACSGFHPNSRLACVIMKRQGTLLLAGKTTPKGACRESTAR